jgi:diadenosine tetraphosphatase ApaH/serine/threonine PP2A family protein phosphatase
LKGDHNEKRRVRAAAGAAPVKVAVLSDIHSNWPALEAVLEDLAGVAGVEQVLCLGDVVGYGADPVRCLDHVRESGWRSLVGNHDRACTDPSVLDWFNNDAAAAVRWTVAQLDEDRLGWLRNLSEREDRPDVVLVHGSLRDPIYEYILDAETAMESLRLAGDRLCFHGHTHVPGVFHVEHGRVGHDYRLGSISLSPPMLVNPGSVGQPRDGEPDASYGIWHPEESRFEFRRVPYDRERAKRAILEAGLPARLALRLDFGR